MKPAGAIIRVSTARQLQGTSPTKQLEGVRALATEQGFEVVDGQAWMMAESGSLRDRAGFRGALDAVTSGSVARVYVYSIDRLGRNLLEMLLFLRDLEDLSIECWEAERGRRLASDDFAVQIEGAVAGKERRDILWRTQDALRREIRAGKFSGGIVAYGYHLDPTTKQLQIDSEEAAVVRKIFEWATEERLSTTEIADRLNGLGIHTRYAKDGRMVRGKGKLAPEHTAGIWRAGRVRNMLRNTAYAGRWEWGKRSKKPRRELIPGICPAIVSVETFQEADRALAANRWKPSMRRTRPYLLRGLIHCANCGLTYIGSTSRVAGGEKRYYRCNGATHWHQLGRAKCPSKSLVADGLERIVWEDIRAFVRRPEVVIDQLRAARAPVDATLGERLNETEGQIGELRRRERNLIRLAAESRQADPQALDDVLGEIRRGLAALGAYRGQLQGRLDAGEGLERELFNVAGRLAKLQGKIDQATFSQKRRAVEELVKGISVATRAADGPRTPVVSIVYRFEDPDQDPAQAAVLFSVGADCTDVPVATPAI